MGKAHALVSFPRSVRPQNWTLRRAVHTPAGRPARTNMPNAQAQRATGSGNGMPVKQTIVRKETVDRIAKYSSQVLSRCLQKTRTLTRVGRLDDGPCMSTVCCFRPQDRQISTCALRGNDEGVAKTKMRAKPARMARLDQPGNNKRSFGGRRLSYRLNVTPDDFPLLAAPVPPTSHPPAPRHHRNPTHVTRNSSHTSCGPHSSQA